MFRPESSLFPGVCLLAPPGARARGLEEGEELNQSSAPSHMAGGDRQFGQSLTKKERGF